MLAIRKAKIITSGQAATIRGELLDLAQCRLAKTGRATLVHVNAAACHSGQVPWSDGLDWDLGFALCALDQQHERPYSLSVKPAVRARAWTDANEAQMGLK